MTDRLKQLMDNVIDVPCGNTWETLSGDDKKRLCLTCDKHVHNLAQLDGDGLRDVTEKAYSAEGVCVVYERMPQPWYSPALLRFTAVVVPLMVLLLSVTADAEPLKPESPECKALMYTPRLMMPEETCVDEQGKETTFRKWQWLPPNGDTPANNSNPVYQTPSDLMKKPE